MRTIEINITKSKIKSFTVDFNNNDNTMNVTATVGLYTDKMKNITDYQVRTNHWESDKQFEIPTKMYKPIFKIGELLEELVTLKCREGQMQLTAPNDDEIPF